MNENDRLKLNGFCDAILSEAMEKMADAGVPANVCIDRMLTVSVVEAVALTSEEDVAQLLERSAARVRAGDLTVAQGTSQ